MTIKLPEVQETTLNMTPMIDIVFNLVIFFMLTLDLAQKEFVEVDLPLARKGIEDIWKEGDIPRFIINLLPDGKVQFKGNTYDLASTDAREQDRALRDMKDFLISLTNNPTWREPDGASKVSVMIHGDRSAKWQYSQWIMMVCANPRVKVYKIQFATKNPPVEE